MDAARTDRVAPGLVVAGVAYRAVALAAGLPPTNSDEATMGLMALHVSEGREVPVYFYGQSYMGALEAYLAAPLVLAVGPSTLVLRVPTLLLTAAFLLVMWRLTSALFPRGVVLLTLGLLALGSDRVLKSQLIAGGGYPEILPLGALLVLLAVSARTPSHGDRRRSYVLVGLFGLGAGLALWISWLVLPYVAAAGLVLLVVRGRRLLGREGLVLVAGVVLGALPAVSHTIGARPGQDPLSVFLRQSGSGAGGGSPADHLAGGVLTGVPLATGLCPPGGCTALQTWWGALYPLLLVAAVALAVGGLRRARLVPDPVERHAEVVRHVGRLALAVAAGLTIVSYARSSAAVETPTESARYLTCLLISTPAVLWPPWVAAREARLWSGPALRWVVRAAPVAVLVAVAVLAVVASGQAMARVPAVRADERDHQRLVTALDDVGATRIYSDYWTCNRLVLATRERILCSTLDEDLRTDNDRYEPYSLAVRSAPSPVYAFVDGAAVERTFARHLRSRGVDATVTTAGGYRIYSPAERLDVPLAP